MNDQIPQWKLNLLANFPRPIAVLLIVVRDWLTKNIYELIAYGIIIGWIASIAIGYIVGKLVGAGIAAGSGIALFFAASLYEEYLKISDTLPKREKKDDDDTRTT